MFVKSKREFLERRMIAIKNFLILWSKGYFDSIKKKLEYLYVYRLSLSRE